MTEITREAYEQGRVRRRDGGALRLHVFADETECNYHLGEVRHSGGKWGPLTWRADGFISPIGEESSLDLILKPRKRTVWTNVYRTTDKNYESFKLYDTKEDAYRNSLSGSTLYIGTYPIEIEED